MILRLAVWGLGALVLLIYGLASAAKRADDADDDLYGRLLPRRRQ